MIYALGKLNEQVRQFIETESPKRAALNVKDGEVLLLVDRKVYGVIRQNEDDDYFIEPNLPEET